MNYQVEADRDGVSQRAEPVFFADAARFFFFRHAGRPLRLRCLQMSAIADEEVRECARKSVRNAAAWPRAREPAVLAAARVARKCYRRLILRGGLI